MCAAHHDGTDEGYWDQLLSIHWHTMAETLQVGYTDSIVHYYAKAGIEERRYNDALHVPDSNMKILLGASGDEDQGFVDSRELWFDYIAVAKYTYPEPTYTVGPETPSVSCGDTVCSPGEEDCENCQGDCLPSPSTQVCCMAEAYDGDCCDDGDCLDLYPDGGYSCQNNVCTITCGDYIIGGDEQCEDFDFGEESCETQRGEGFHGYLVCDENCQIDAMTSCFKCGDGIIDEDEQCDPNTDTGGSPNMGDSITCADLYGDTVSGDLTCTTDCLYDDSQCEGCGNVIKEEGEECDGFDFGEETCQTLNDERFFGYLICRAPDYCDTPPCDPPACTIDNSECFECGNEIVDSYEDCDDGTHCADGITSCTSAADCIGTDGGDGLCKKRNTANCFDDCTIGPKYLYDDNDNLVMVDYPGISGDTYYNYDIDQNLVFEAQVLSDGVVITEYEYSADNLVYYGTPGEESYFAYNVDGEITREEYTITDYTTGEEITEVTTYDYDADGRISCVNCGADATGEKEEYEYDWSGNLVKYATGETDGGEGLASFQVFDSNGRLMSKIDDVGHQAEYSYDEEGNLATINDEGYFGESMAFDDECGNIVEEGVVYNPETCNLETDGVYNYYYLEDGNLERKVLLDEDGQETDEVTTYIYDEDNNLIRIEYSDGTSTTSVQYEYENDFPVRLIDSDGATYVYLEPGDDSSSLPESDFFALLGNEDEDLNINHQDYFIAIENDVQGIRLTSILYNWILIS